MLGSKGDGEGIVRFVLGHGGDGDVGGIGKIGFGAAVDISEELSDFSHTIGAVVEEEEGIII